MHESNEYVQPSFAEAIDVSAFVKRKAKLRRQIIVLRAIVVLLVVGAIVAEGIPLTLQWQSDKELSATSDASAQQVSDWPYPQAEDELKAARAYNKRLAQNDQPILGEAADPFAIEEHGTDEEAKSKSSQDKEYQALLDTGSGIMGTIRIPEISVKLPIYHGTSETALASGAGHLYGTSLPVGGKNTHAVITGHRGLVESLMFTRLDEMREGDFFYIEVMGETLGYEVDSISEIMPTDTSQLTIRPGEDRVTLMTCTPYGVNTQRLLVSGHRVHIPQPAPNPTNLRDWRTIGIWTCAGILVIGFIVCALTTRLRHAKAFPMRHAANR